MAQFIHTHIHSVEQLEVLLLLRAAGGTWSGETVARELRISPISAAGRLADLQRRHLLAPAAEPGTYSYAPATEQLAETVSHLAATYVQARFTIINLIFSSPEEKLRTFANAFRFKKGDS